MERQRAAKWRATSGRKVFEGCEVIGIVTTATSVVGRSNTDVDSRHEHSISRPHQQRAVNALVCKPQDIGKVIRHHCRSEDAPVEGHDLLLLLAHGNNTYTLQIDPDSALTSQLVGCQ